MDELNLTSAPLKAQRPEGGESLVTQRWRAVVAYDGGEFLGWQSQAGGGAVQDFLERRLAEIGGGPVRVHGSGRTDRGVHAIGQVCHFDLAWPHGAALLLRALRTGLPSGLLVRSVAAAPAGFHARYGATGKRYVYRLHRGVALPLEARACWALPDRALDLVAMQAAAARFVGEHDFRAFAATPADGQVEDTCKTLWKVAVTGTGRRLKVVLEGSGFLYKMARSLVGAIVAVGQGKLSLTDIDALLAGTPRGNRYVTAPAEGLTLERVWYASARQPTGETAAATAREAGDSGA